MFVVILAVKGRKKKYLACSFLRSGERGEIYHSVHLHCPANKRSETFVFHGVCVIAYSVMIHCTTSELEVLVFKLLVPYSDSTESFQVVQFIS